jgi:hypothetical protein
MLRSLPSTPKLTRILQKLDGDYGEAYAYVETMLTITSIGLQFVGFFAMLFVNKWRRAILHGKN